MAVAWFGPKGFASILYSLPILRSSVPLVDDMFGVVTITIALSIVAHSSTELAGGSPRPARSGPTVQADRHVA